LLSQEGFALQDEQDGFWFDWATASTAVQEEADKPATRTIDNVFFNPEKGNAI